MRVSTERLFAKRSGGCLQFQSDSMMMRRYRDSRLILAAGVIRRKRARPAPVWMFHRPCENVVRWPVQRTPCSVAWNTINNRVSRGVVRGI